MNKILAGCFMLVLVVGVMAGCGGGGGGGGLGLDTTTAPTVILTDPANGDTFVPINRLITATATFTLRDTTAGVAVTGAVTYDAVNHVATFTPTSNLAASHSFDATITSGAKDLAGNALALNKAWSFTTGVSADATAPTVSSTDPANGATRVLINRKIAATFSEAMNPITITTATFTLRDTTAAVAVTGAVTYDTVSHVATFTPTSNLAASHSFDATITSGATDLAGNALASNEVWSFTTGAAADGTAPTVSSTDPANGATGVLINREVAATFSEAMNPLTITAATFTLRDTTAGVAVTGAVTYDAISHIATFTPTSNLAASHFFNATITTGARDLAGNALAHNRVWSFRTGGSSAAGPEPVTLGAAGAFNILAGSAVTNADTVSNPTTINGLVGVFPGSAVTGLPTASVPASRIHAGDTVAAAAKVALLAAYNDAVSRSVGAISLPGNMGGLTLAPGLYVNSTSSGISGTGTNAILTLDAQGDANAVWIFKMGSTLITDTGTSIVLAGGAQAKNIFWQVGSSATLGTNSIFKGNILAAISITLTTGVNLKGRALAQTGAVTLDKNAITLP
jgi:hypothetical protein